MVSETNVYEKIRKIRNKRKRSQEITVDRFKLSLIYNSISFKLEVLDDWFKTPLIFESNNLSNLVEKLEKYCAHEKIISAIKNMII